MEARAAAQTSLAWASDQVRLLGDLCAGRLPAKGCPEVPLGPVQLLQPLHDVHGHPNHARLVGQCPRDGLADPPGGVGGELVPPAPVELLDGADEPQRAFLDQVEERQALVAVVLGDRDDEAQVRLDHPLLGGPVAGLDPLGELDLLLRGQERMPACLAQEELQGVRRRLPRERKRRGDGLGLRLWRAVLAEVVDDVDLPGLELAVDEIGLERVDAERLEHVVQFGLQDRAALLARVDKAPEIVAEEQDVGPRGHAENI